MRTADDLTAKFSTPAPGRRRNAKNSLTPLRDVTLRQRQRQRQLNGLTSLRHFYVLRRCVLTFCCVFVSFPCPFVRLCATSAKYLTALRSQLYAARKAPKFCGSAHAHVSSTRNVKRLTARDRQTGKTTTTASTRAAITMSNERASE